VKRRRHGFAASRRRTLSVGALYKTLTNIDLCSTLVPHRNTIPTMCSITLCVFLLTSLLPTVIAKGRGGGHGGGGGGPSKPVHFKSPPLAIAVVASDAVFFIVTAFQLSITINPKRTTRLPSGHRPSITAIISTLIFLLVAYALAVTLTATTWTLHDSGEPSVYFKQNININIAATLFWTWIDALMFVAVFIVLRDRYLTPMGKPMAEELTSRTGPPLLPFNIVSSIIFLLFVFAIANVGVWGSAVLGQYDNSLSQSQAHDKVVISNDLITCSSHLLLSSRGATHWIRCELQLTSLHVLSN